MTFDNPYGLFRELNAEEEKEFRQWAHDHPKDKVDNLPYELIHPVVRDEWDKIEESYREP